MTAEEILNVLEKEYDILSNLTKRLQEDYNGDKQFEQKEEDRLALCNILEAIEEYEDQPIKNIMEGNIIEINLNEQFYLFIEKLNYDPALLIELCDYEDHDAICNILDLDLWCLFTPESTISEIKKGVKNTLKENKEKLNEILDNTVWG